MAAHQYGQETPHRHSPQVVLAAGGIVTALGLLIFLVNTQPVTQPLLLLVGLAFGYTLFHARFGFTPAFHRLMALGDGKEFRGHLLMFAIATSLFAPVLATGYSFFESTNAMARIAPVSFSLLVGAFMFGVGMQLAKGCASGTLYAAGGGRILMFVTLFFFVAGSVLGSYHFSFWAHTFPSLGKISLATTLGLGYYGAWIVSICFFGTVYLVVRAVERKMQPSEPEYVSSVEGWKRIIQGTWPIFVGATFLALLNLLVLLISGKPWDVTSAFVLWGGKIAQQFGADVASWGYWQNKPGTKLYECIFQDPTTVLNFGIIIGAFIAASAGGVFHLKKVTFQNIFSATIGGFMMGYGACLAYGCNIGSYFSGIASFSLHGYVWGIMALLGTFTVVSVKPLHKLSVSDKE